MKPKIISIEHRNPDSAISLALDTLMIGKQCIIFVNTKRGAESLAEKISQAISKDKKHDYQARLDLDGLSKASTGILEVLPSPTKQCTRLSLALKYGAAFHHSGLVSGQRDIVEKGFRDGIIKFIVATPTLAMGVDLPAFRVIIRDMKRFGQWGMAYIPVLEYEQQAGRAGRPSYDNYGEAICIVDTELEKSEIEERYINGVSEEISSKLAVEPIMRTYILSLISSQFIRTTSGLRDFFSKTFYARQYGDMGKLSAIIEKMLGQLEEWGFIEYEDKSDNTLSADKNFVSALKFSFNKNNDRGVSATILGRRVSELYLDPYTANHIINSLKVGISKQPDNLFNAYSLVHLCSTCLELRPLVRVKSRDIGLYEEEVLRKQDHILTDVSEVFDEGYDEFLDSMKTSSMFMDWLEEYDEEFLLEKYDVRPGELRAKLDIVDWLLYSMEELSKLLKMHVLVKDIAKTRFRLKYGAKEELIPLLQLTNIGRVRARKMYASSIKNVGDVKRVDITTLSQILGRNIALDVKKQVGEDLSEDKVQVKENKRKGQINLNDYGE